ncbi:efflux RND transporter permease subunit [Methylocystis parvus]|uniref:copper-binding protein n=1 Tax=Methylocystis parvus TaxID=134 RepID=UPI003C77E87C
MWSTGTGSEVMQRIAVPMIGGMVSSTLLTLIVIPAIYAPSLGLKRMAFKVAPGLSLEGLAQGVKVAFTVSKSPQGGYVIEQIKRSE